MATLYDKDGNEVEAATAEEQEALKTQAVEEFKAANPDIANIEDTKTKLATAEAELARLKESDGDKSKNIDGQRKAIEAKEKEIADLKTSMATTLQEMKDFVVGRSVNELIKKVSGGDAEVAKKIRHHFDKTLGAMKAETDDEIAEKITAALKLADVKSANPGALDDVAGSGGANGGNNNNDANKPSSALVDFGKKFNISEDDWKKYGGKH